MSLDPFNLVGTTLSGKFRIETLLGDSPNAIVYAGVHLSVGQPVAIKCMKPVGSPREAERASQAFLREAQALFQLNHPGIVRVFDVGDLGDALKTPFIVLELVHGTSLDQEIARRKAQNAPFRADELVALFGAVGSALAFAHEHGVVHGDLRPANLVVTKTPNGSLSAKLDGFALARVGDHRQTAFAEVATQFYAAPEQRDPRLGPIGPPSDVFSLGLVLTEACTLQPPLEGANPIEIFAAAADGAKRVPVGRLRPDLPRPLEGILKRATAPEPRARLSAREFNDAFLGTMTTAGARWADPGPAAPPEAHRPRAVPSGGSRLGVGSLVVAGGAAAAALILVGAVVVFVFGLRSTSRPNFHLASRVSVANIFIDPALLSKAAILRVVEGHAEEVERCYEKALTRTPNAKGKVNLSFAFPDPPGDADPIACGSDRFDDALCTCVSAAAASWPVPKPKRRPTAATVVFELKP